MEFWSLVNEAGNQPCETVVRESVKKSCSCIKGAALGEITSTRAHLAL